MVVVLSGCSSETPDDPVASPPTSGPPPSATAPPAVSSVRVLTLNLLHGLFCPEETDSCQAPDRVAIFSDLVEAADCPDLIGLQEIGARLEELMPPTVDDLCGGRYSIAWEALDSPDRAMVLTRLPVVDRGSLDLANFPWEAYWVRVEAAPGPVDFLTAHFASSANDPPCLPDRCPPVCPEGISTNECHAREVVDLFDHRPPGAALAIVGGDLNADPRSPTLATLRDGGFRDAWLAGGQPECDPESHVGCTAGGDEPEPFVGMDTAAGPQLDSRIDYVLVRPAQDCAPDISAEGFADRPASPPRNGMHWPSDHAGVLATVGCR